MKKLITELFQSVYENARNETPEFLIHAWEDAVRHAMRNLDSEDSVEILTQEAIYVAQRSGLKEAYDRVLSTVLAVPEDLQPAMLFALSSGLDQVMVGLGLSESVQAVVHGELSEALSHFDQPTEAQIAAVQAIIENAG